MYHHVCQGEGEVGQAEEQQHRVVVQPAEDRDVGEDHPHLAEFGQAHEQRAGQVESERRRVGALGADA
jgi:hypothetical protein